MKTPLDDTCINMFLVEWRDAVESSVLPQPSTMKLAKLSGSVYARYVRFRYIRASVVLTDDIDPEEDCLGAR